MPCLSQVYVYKSKCVYIYSGNSTILVLDNRRWGADSTSTSFPPVPGAHSCGWPGQMFSAPICTVPRMAFVAINGNRLSKHGPLCSQIKPRPGSHLGHRAIRRPRQIQHVSLRVGECPTRLLVTCKGSIRLRCSQSTIVSGGKCAYAPKLPCCSARRCGENPCREEKLQLLCVVVVCCCCCCCCVEKMRVVLFSLAVSIESWFRARPPPRGLLLLLLLYEPRYV